MKTKSFEKYLEKRLNKQEIAEIKYQAQLEVAFLRSMQKMLADAVAEYMEKNNIGFNEVVRRLDSSPAQVAKIQRGEANLTLSTFAHVLALMNIEPHEVFKIRK
jgi:hypothetical protein